MASIFLENLWAHDVKYGLNRANVENKEFGDTADYRSKCVSRRKRTVESELRHFRIPLTRQVKPTRANGKKLRILHNSTFHS